MTDRSALPFAHATGHHGFRDDKYYRFTKTSVTVMAGWPRMLAWQRSARKPGWRMVRPHSSLGYLTPNEFKAGQSTPPPRTVLQ